MNHKLPIWRDCKSSRTTSIAFHPRINPELPTWRDCEYNMLIDMYIVQFVVLTHLNFVGCQIFTDGHKYNVFMHDDLCDIFQNFCSGGDSSAGEGALYSTLSRCVRLGQRKCRSCQRSSEKCVFLPNHIKNVINIRRLYIIIVRS